MVANKIAHLDASQKLIVKLPSKDEIQIMALVSRFLLLAQTSQLVQEK
jgi:hypothetical protein